MVLDLQGFNVITAVREFCDLFEIKLSFALLNLFCQFIDAETDRGKLNAKNLIVVELVVECSLVMWVARVRFPDDEIFSLVLF